jgi:hypothetical protein
MVDGGDLEEPKEPEHPEQGRSGRRPVGYAVAGAVVVIAIAAVIALLAGGSGGNESADPLAGDADSSGGGRERVHDLLPENGRFPAPAEKVGSMREAARAAGCELKSYEVVSKNHIASPGEPVAYESDPPTSGRHHPVPADDDAYAVAPDVRRIVHTLEHGRVAVWFERDLPRSARASLKAFYVDDPHQLLLVPDTTEMPYAVAATAWNRDPTPNGTGRLLGCREYSDDVYTALDAFRDRNRGRGPELIP